MFIRDPFFNRSSFNEMLKEVQDGLRDVPNVVSTITSGGKYPFTDICTDQYGILHIEMAIAGFAKEDLTISLHDGVLEVTGSVSKETKDDDKNMVYHQRQIAKRDFTSRYKLAEQFARSENIDASTNNGILTISIWPVEKEKEKPLSITIS